MRWRIGLLLALLLGAHPPAAAQSFTWNAEFYNNPDLQGAPALTRQDAAIAFDWGGGAPAPGVKADFFSARWTAEPTFTGGAYRFSAVADDWVRVWVGNTALIDTFQQPLVGQVISADVTLPAGVHRIRVEYREESGNASVFVNWTAQTADATAASVFPALASGPWTAEYYANSTLSGSPTLIQSEVSPNHDWGHGSPVASLPVDNWSARWTRVETLEAGDYQIVVRADDGARVLVNGNLVIDQFGASGGQPASATVTLPAGQHTIVIEFVELSGVAFLNYKLAWVANGQAAPAITGPRATVVNAFRLNVRAVPDTVQGAVLARINQGDTYPVIGRNADGSWWQIRVDDLVGWVSASYVTVADADAVPVIQSEAAAGGTSCAAAPPPRLSVGRTGRVTPGLANNLRDQASPDALLLGQIPAGGVFTVVSGPQCAGGLYWWQVRYNRITGWTPEGGGGQYWLEPVE